MVQESFEKLQHRKDEDLPLLPSGLVRGSPDSVLSVVVQPVEATRARPEEVRSQILRVRERIRQEAGELAPSQSAWPGLANWEPDRNQGL